MKSLERMGLSDQHSVEIALDNEEPQYFPAEFTVVEDRAVVVGDEFGMRVASFPYQDLEETDTGVWRGTSDVGNFTLSSGPPLGDFGW
jgi:hypothetical protein